VQHGTINKPDFSKSLKAEPVLERFGLFKVREGEDFKV